MTLARQGGIFTGEEPEPEANPEGENDQAGKDGHSILQKPKDHKVHERETDTNQQAESKSAHVRLLLQQNGFVAVSHRLRTAVRVIGREVLTRKSCSYECRDIGVLQLALLWVDVGTKGLKRQLAFGCLYELPCESRRGLSVARGDLREVNVVGPGRFSEFLSLFPAGLT